MASSSSKPTAVHFSMILVGLLALGLTISTGLLYSKLTEAQLREQQAKDDATKNSSALNQQVQDVQDAMTLIGGPRTNWPESRAAAVKAIQTLGAGQEKQTMLATIEQLRSTLEAANLELTSVKQDLQKERETVLKLQSDYGKRVDVHDRSQKESEALVQKTAAERDEIVQKRDREIAQLKDEKRNEQIEKEQYRDQLERTERTLSDRIRSLSMIVDSQKDRIEELLKTSFEVADGEIVSVDANLKTVFINVGELDNLRPQVSFSVYTHDHRGIGRQVRDIKGRVEVTRLLGPHLAEARILEQDRTRPISEGDPIYSPVWAGGRTEYFALVGLIDFDNDGKSDRDALHRALKSAGAGIGLEINDDGQREPPDAKIDVNTKFLVLGDIPDPTKFATGDEGRLKADRIGQEFNALLGEARAAGVRVVRLDDFLAYMGYKPQQRYFVPGQVQQFNLKNGARDAAVRSDQDAAGQTSPLFERMRKADETKY